MPILNGAGYSKYTKEKQEVLSVLLSWQAGIAGEVQLNHGWIRRTYIYIDATAGPGYFPPCDELPCGCKGSPLIALDVLPDALSKSELIPEFYFVDSKPENYLALQSQIASLETPYKPSIRCGDFADVIPEIIGNGGRDLLGMVYIDPTVPLHYREVIAISQVMQKLPRVEILINIASAIVKRVTRMTRNRTPTIDNLMRDIGKSGWLIRRPVDNEQWTFLLGTNAPDGLFDDYKRIQFYSVDSPIGRRYLDKCRMTKKEMQYEQMYLPGTDPIQSISDTLSSAQLGRKL